jgi:RND family efflux transporter MFP subunit
MKATLNSARVQSWLQDYCGRSAGVAGGVVMSAADDGGLHTAAEWPAEGNLSPPLIAAATAAVERARPLVIKPSVAARNAGAARVISLPLKSGDRAFGAVALALESIDEEATSRLLKELERACIALAVALGAQPRPGADLDAAQVLHFQNLLLGRSRLGEAATVLASELAAARGFERTSIGLVDGGRIRVLALSHSAEFKSRQELLRSIAAVMEEAVDQAASVCYPADESAPPRIVLAHAELAARAGSALCTVPMACDGKVVGALCFERSGKPPGAQELAGLEHMACLLAPMLVLRQRAEAPWSQRSGEAFKRLGARIAQRDDPWPKLALAAAVVALAAATTLPLAYRVGAPARIEGAVQRIVAAPAEGFLRSAHARPGDVVKAGDLLVELDGQDLLLEKRKWESELTQYENTYGAALARADRAQFVINHAKATEARAQLELVEQRLARTRLTAPIDGMVIKGDLSQSLGAPVQRGEALITLAPLDQYRLIIEVDERDVADVREGQKGYLALSAMPADSVPFTVARVTPVATSGDGRNGFEVQATLAASGGPLRPGLQGVAKIEVGERSAAWLLGHRIVDWLRLHLWIWGG